MLKVLFCLLLLPIFIVALQFFCSINFFENPLSAAAETHLSETRCGWFSNPTPANASLFDREGEWIISEQGGYEAEGDWGDFGKQWIKTNGNYGYGCGCVRGQFNQSEKKVVKIENFRTRPLSVCRKDKALKKYGFK